eukprot:609479-Pleurochrysis_carterae.AAC.1
MSWNIRNNQARTNAAARILRNTIRLEENVSITPAILAKIDRAKEKWKKVSAGTSMREIKFIQELRRAIRTKHKVELPDGIILQLLQTSNTMI